MQSAVVAVLQDTPQESLARLRKVGHRLGKLSRQPICPRLLTKGVRTLRIAALQGSPARAGRRTSPALLARVLLGFGERAGRQQGHQAQHRAPCPAAAAAGPEAPRLMQPAAAAAGCCPVLR